MKGVLIALSLMAIILNAEAQWTKLPITGSPLDQYVDLTKIDKKRKPYPALWVLNDFRNEEKKNAFGKSYKSTVVLYEINCSSRRLRVTTAYYYQNSMGEGQIVDSIDTDLDNFYTPPPNTAPELYIKLVCSN